MTIYRWPRCLPLRLLQLFLLPPVILALTCPPADAAPPARTVPAAPVAAAAPDNATDNTKPEDPISIEVSPEGVSVFAVAVDAHALLTRLARETGLRLIVDDSIRRTMTVNLVHKPVSEVLDGIVSAYGLSCREVNGIFIVSEGIPTSPSSYLLSDIDSIRTRYVLAPNAKSLLPVFLQDHVKTNAEQNAVILSAPPDVLRKFRQDIAQFDIPAAQIMIDVLMVEFSDSGSREFGLSWSWTDGGRQVSSSPSIGEVFLRTLSALPAGFHADLHALVAEGKARVRANPRIATVSGRRASIFIGKQRYLSTPVVIGGAGQDFYNMRQANSIDAGVKLDMTPWTGGEGEIIVDIQPEISVLSAPDAKTGLPDKSTRRADTTVHVRDGETIIIGGLVQNETMTTRTRVPILGDLPLLGPLFRTKDEQTTATEMVIFITPRILPPPGRGTAEPAGSPAPTVLPEGPSRASSPSDH